LGAVALFWRMSFLTQDFLKTVLCTAGIRILRYQMSCRSQAKGRLNFNQNGPLSGERVAPCQSPPGNYAGEPVPACNAPAARLAMRLDHPKEPAKQRQPPQIGAVN